MGHLPFPNQKRRNSGLGIGNSENVGGKDGEERNEGSGDWNVK